LSERILRAVILNPGASQNDSRTWGKMADQDEIIEGAPVAPEPKDGVPSDTSQPQKPVEDLRSAANALVEEYSGKVDEVWSHANDRVRRHPAKAVLSAVGIGFVLGLIFRR
jgi:ElaB/YqjD/DUF883 family membrane-anchored ribosome-binding protein